MVKPGQAALDTHRLDPQRRVLWRDGPACLSCPVRADGCQRICTVEGRAVPTQVGQRACDLLSALVTAHGAVVSKDALIARVWPGQIVEENALQAQISLLRKALGETGQRCIVTVPGRGYRLVGESVAIEGAAATDEAAPSTATAGLRQRGQPAIAVLPFDNLSGDSADAWLADGMADDLIVELSRSRSWMVISRGASFVYKGGRADVRQIGRDLDVRYVLGGSVRRSGDRLRITAQLTETEHCTGVWAEQYDRAFTDVFAILCEIARSASLAIEPAVEMAEQSRVLRKRLDRLDAWEAWQRSKSHRDAWDWQNADLLLDRVIRLDPGFAAPHAERALYLWAAAAAEWSPFRETCARAEAECREAIRLDPANVEAHSILSFCKCSVRDAAGALHLAERAIQLGPSVWIARVAIAGAQMGLRQFDKAAPHVEILQRLAPRGPIEGTALEMKALLHFLRGEYETAAAVAEGVIAIRPQQRHAYWILLASLGHLGRRDRTRDLMIQWHTTAPRQSAQFAELGVPWLSEEDSDRAMLGLRAAGWDGWNEPG